MNLHEYQGKEVLASYGVAIQRGKVASTVEEAVTAFKELQEDTGTGWHVIKAQIHAGGRGKGGGVKLAKSLEEVKEISSQILGMQLVTPQTSAEGKKVHQVLGTSCGRRICPDFDACKEYYVSVLMRSYKEETRNYVLY